MVFRKDIINHIARLITYVDIKKGKQPKLITLLTNDFDMPLETIVAIIPPSLANRVAFQADKAELSSEIFLWRKRKRHQNSDMGDSHRKSIALCLAKQAEKTMELLGTRHNRADCADVLPGPRKVP